VRGWLESLPADSGLAVLVVQTAPASQRDTLMRELASTTSLPVIHAKDGHRVEPNTIVIVPPRTSATLVRGVLVLRVAKARAKSSQPIDELLSSLAAALGERTVGVVLAGTGPDGVAGLEAVRRAGGRVLAPADLGDRPGAAAPRMARGSHAPTGTTPLRVGRRSPAAATAPAAQADPQDLARLIVESVPMAVVVLDAELRIRAVNPGFLAAFGDGRDAVGRALEELGSWRPTDLGTLLPGLYRSRARVLDVLVEHTRNGGSARTYHLTASQLSRPSARMLVLSLADVTEHLRGEGDRSTNTVQRDTFLTALSDEIRGPLSAIMLWAEVASMLPAGDPTYATAIETIKEAAREESRLVDDLLDLAMVGSGELAIEPVITDAAPIIAAVVEELRTVAHVKDVTLVADLDAGCQMLVDPRRLEQITRSLLKHAVERSPAGEDVTATLARGRRFVELRITDKGMAIRAGALPHVFEPFTHHDRTTSRRHHGQRVGLALARMLAERHGGTIDVTSAEGGTTFTVLLPFAR
jgi:signal transduction histidine kinase